MSINVPSWFSEDPQSNFNEVDNVFEKLNPDYDNEKEVFDMLEMEAYNRLGTPFLFYIVSYNKDYNPVYGEDMDRRIERAFEFMGMPDALPEERLDFGFQIEGLDNFVIYVNKTHFHYMSSKNIPSITDLSGRKFTDFSLNHLTEDNGTGSIVWAEEFLNTEFSSEFDIGMPFESYIPKVGDIVKMKFNEYLYEVKAVKEEDEMFHQHKYAWTIRLGKWTNQHLTIDHTDFNEEGITPTVEKPVEEMELDLSVEIDAYKNTQDSDDGADTFPTTGKGKPKILYTPSNNEKNPKFKDEGW